MIISLSKKKENVQLVIFQNMLVIYLSINLFADIKKVYEFQSYNYLKNKMALSLFLVFNIVYFDNYCSVTLYDSLIF